MIERPEANFLPLGGGLFFFFFLKKSEFHLGFDMEINSQTDRQSKNMDSRAESGLTHRGETRKHIIKK